ncbi:MAG: N-acetyl-alpha-D-glucosaminyl L-malate synthase BshA [Sphingomonadales bacterium]|nr:N-acetyl-alpha-D-glucosaminyl L-malate synthase BshA [Sphingomonadales bacterium]
MKIAVVCYPTYGGSGVVATELGMGLAQKGHEVHFVSSSQPARLDLLNERIHYHEVTMLHYPVFDHSPYLLALTGKLVDVVRHEGIELVHAHYAIPHATAALLARDILRREGIPLAVVTTLHGTDVTLVGKDPGYEPVVSHAINLSDGVTAVSESLRTDTLAHFHIDKPIQVIPNFLDLDRFRQRNPCRFTMALAGDNQKRLIHISNFRKVKRVDLVIRIFALIREQIPACLLLVGDGPERPRCEQLCRELGIAMDVRFLGKQEAVEEILSAGDLFLLPSETESFGLAALEAMACGVPVLSSRSGGLPEVNVDGVTGFLTDADDMQGMAQAAMRLLGDDELMQQFRLAARRQAERFDLHQILPLYEEAYRLALQRSGGS